MNTLSKRLLLSVACLIPLVVIGCGSTDVTGGAGGSSNPGTGGTNTTPTGCQPSGDKLLPFAEGYSWTYQVTDLDKKTVESKTNTVGANETVGGDGPNKDKTAFKVVTSKKDGKDKTESWQAPDGDKVLRFRELSYTKQGTIDLEEHWAPHRIHIDGTAEHTVADATWTEIYEETKKPNGGQSTTMEKRDVWRVESASESVTVAAGTFTAVKITKSTSSQNTKTYWYVRGIGKVKETGSSQTEELVDCKVTQ